MISCCCTNIERSYRMHTGIGSTGKMFFFVCIVTMCVSLYTGMLFSTWVRHRDDQQQWRFCCTAVFYAVWLVSYCCFLANVQLIYANNNYLCTGSCVLWKFAEKSPSSTTNHRYTGTGTCKHCADIMQNIGTSRGICTGSLVALFLCVFPPSPGSCYGSAHGFFSFVV